MDENHPPCDKTNLRLIRPEYTDWEGPQTIAKATYLRPTAVHCDEGPLDSDLAKGEAERSQKWFAEPLWPLRINLGREVSTNPKRPSRVVRLKTAYLGVWPNH